MVYFCPLGFFNGHSKRYACFASSVFSQSHLLDSSEPFTSTSAQNRSFDAVLVMVWTRTMASPRLARWGLPSSTQRDVGGLFCAPALDANANESITSAIAAVLDLNMPCLSSGSSRHCTLGTAAF